MDTSVLRKKALFFCVILLVSFGASETTALKGNLTHLKPLIATNNNNGINDNNKKNHQSQTDTSAQESVKIENRQLYDTVKHASGYDPDINNNYNNNSQYASIKEIEETSNSNLSSSATRARIHPRKSAVIQAIPRKVRGPGGNTLTASASGATFVKPPSSLQPTVKDYGAGEPTTTIVYATSIPTSMPSRTFVNIRPVPLLSSQKYRSTVVVENERPNHHPDLEKTKPVVEHQQYSDDEQQEQQQQEQSNDNEHNQEQKLLVLKRTILRDDSNSMQSTTTPRAQDVVLPFQTDQQKPNPHKSILYSRIRMNNEEIKDDLPTNNRHIFYPNHKWTAEDYMQRGLQLVPPPLPPPLPLTPPSTHFVYENQDPQRDYYHPPLSPHTHPPAAHQTQTQNLFRPRYIATDGYHEEMYNPGYDQQQGMHGILSQQQERQQQQYQPLTVRDFDLLLQLLVLREQRLHASHQDPFLLSSTSDFNCRNNHQENSYYYGSPKALASSVHEYPNNFRSREPIKTMQNSLLRSQQQLSTTKLLPSNVREELLFRMLLLALHLQPQIQSKHRSEPVSNIQTMLTENHHHHNMYHGSPTATSPLEPSQYLGLRHSHRSSTFKNPVRSVQVLGEID